MRVMRWVVVWMLLLGMVPLAACGSGGSTMTPWANYPHQWKSPIQNRPFLIIKCKLSDTPNVPAGFDTAINNFMTIAGLGTGNMLDYYADISNGAVSLDGDRVIGWYNAGFNAKSGLDRGASIAACANAVPDGDVDFSAYWGIVTIMNGPYGGGAWGVGQNAITIHGKTYQLGQVMFDNESLWTWFAAHEIGHGLGLPHSYDNLPLKSGCDPNGNTAPGEYRDSWDMMSSQCTYAFKSANYPNTNTDQGPNANSAGPGMSLPNLLYMGWIRSALPTYTAYQPPKTITLAALSHPNAIGALGVKLYPNAQSQGDYYTIEYRQKDGWDAGIPENAVVIHEFKANIAGPNTPFSFLQSNTFRDEGAWFPGQAWTDPSNTIQVCILGINPSKATATVEVGVPAPFCDNGPRVKIMSPPNGSEITAGQPFILSADVSDYSGKPLPTQSIVWQANGAEIGTGATLTTQLNTVGVATIKVSATDANGVTASDSIMVNVVAAAATPPPAPSITILSPTQNQIYMANGSPVTFVLSAEGSTGIVSWAWSDSLNLFTDNKQNDSVTVTPSISVAPCGLTTDTITLIATDGQGQTTSASVQVMLDHLCVN